MPEQQDTNQKSCCRGCCRFHRSTLVIVLLVIFPWLLVALPGRYHGVAGSTGFSTTHYSHGLPCIFLDRQTVYYSGIWANRKFTLGVKPKDIDFDAEAAEHLAASIQREANSHQSTGQFVADDRLEDLDISSDYQSRFWSDPDRWPWIGTADGEAMQLRWLGLLLDVLLILLVFWLLASAIEYRLKKRGSDFAFSLVEVLLTTCVVSVFLTWFAGEYRRAQQENTAVDRLLTVVNMADQCIKGERSNSLPVLVSELCDHRSSFPLLETHMFRPVEQVRISIYNFDEAPDGTAESLADAMQKADFPINLEVNLDEKTLPLFKNDKAISSVEIFDLDFDFDLEYDDLTDDYVDNIDLGFKLNFQKVKELSVSLQSEIDEAKQLRLITSLESLERLKIDEVNQNGAAYLSSVASRFPSLKEVDLGFVFDSLMDNANNTIQDFIDPDFKLKLPKADKTTITISLQTDIDQKKQLGVFAFTKHLARLTINDLNQEGVAYLAAADTKFPTAKRLEVSFKFSSDVDNPILSNRYKIDLDFKLPFPRVEEIKIHLQPEYDQEKQLQMFGPLDRFTHLRIRNVNKQGAAYLNSIANELPANTRVEFDGRKETIELLPPMKEGGDSFFAPW